MTVSDRYARLGDWLWYLMFAAGSSAACVATAWQIGATFDEPIYVTRSLEGWRTASHAGLLHLGTMPLALDLFSLPLFLWERWHGTSFDLPQDVESMLPWFRLPALVFWWLLLIYARLIGRRLGGPWGGRLAVAFLACEPSLLAHASLGTTDVAVTACLLAFAYHFRTGRESTWPRQLAWPAIWYAAAVLAKASGLVFGPLCMVVLEGERLARQGTLRRPPRHGITSWCRETWDHFRPLRRDMVVIVGAGLALVFVYCGCDWKPLPSFVAWAHSLPDGLTGREMAWLSEHLCVFSNAGEGLLRQVSHNMRGHGVFMLGKSGPSYFWYYFPVALTMKLSVPLLLGPLVVAAVRWRSLLNWALLTAAVFLLFSLNCHVQIGIRLVLPLCAMLAVGLAAALSQAVRSDTPSWQRHLLTAVAVVAVLWPAAAAVAVWPNWLCYHNELWGGTARGYLRLSDSNYDWGQGVPELARWRQHHADTPLDVWYFGTDPALERLPAHQLRLHSLAIETADDVLVRVRGHYLAASTTLLYGGYARGDEGKSMRNAAHFLRGQKPVARTTTFLIYDFTRPEAEIAAKAQHH
ncbi:MAG TPA: glycosyltransferase family 39 protein [Gemmataceae bacterium]|nr:glycosyltransferase family 39 protein [Gemmataceae bacterium]